MPVGSRGEGKQCPVESKGEEVQCPMGSRGEEGKMVMTSNHPLCLFSDPGEGRVKVVPWLCS